MHTTSVLAALAAFASYASAAPAADAGIVSDVAGKLGFTISQVEGKTFVKNGAIARRRAIQKYRGTVPNDVQEAAAAAVTGTVSASPEANDRSYLSPVTVGTNSVMLDFDTGSADLWCFSNLQPSSQTSGHTLYTHNTGTLKQGYTWNITYGDGSGASGVVYGDKVVIGGVTATSQAVEAATSVSSSFSSDTDNDGLVGLAYSKINTVKPTKQTTFFDTVKSQLASPLFTAYLKYKAAGSYDFGFINSNKYTGTIAYASVIQTNGFWEFNANGYSVGSGAETTTTLDSIADTGTSLILTTNAVINAYYSQVSGAYYESSVGGVIFPCTSTLPTFSIYIGSNKRTVPGNYINYVSVGSGYCYGGIQSNSGLPFSILGDVFLKSQLVVFDGGNNRVGFAQQK